MVLLSQELAVVLAAVAVKIGRELSGTCSRLSTVSSSVVGGIEISGSASVEVSIAVVSALSAGVDPGTEASACDVGG